MGNRWPTNVWADSHILSDLMQMAGEKQNTRVIACELSAKYGVRITRNMVIGKARRENIGLLSNRMGSLGRPKPNGKRKGAKDNKLLHFKARDFAPVAATIPVEPLKIPFMQWNERTQCANVEDGKCNDGLDLRCGHPRVNGSSFCEHHHVLYWMPATPAKRTPFVFGGRAA
jgi:hypothetical protein